MPEMPETRFTRAGDVDIAYQVVGPPTGLDLVFIPGWVSHLEVMWELPEFARFLDRLAAMGRLIMFDKRGTGLSDRVAGVPTLEQRADDVAAVMDAVGSARAAITTLARSPWRHQENAVLAAEAETPLERRLSLTIMRGGAKPRVTKVRAGETLMAEGEAADHIVLVLDGMVEVDVGGTVLAKLGPGAVLGERAALEQGRRTATIRAVTDCRVVSYLAADLSSDDLRELAAGHHREDEAP
jgi:Cyclic nucleotide-binding domain